jgi:hypothetical protein
MVGTTVQDVVEGGMKWNDRVDYSYVPVCNKHHQRNSLASTVRYGTVRYGTVRYGTVRYGTVRYGTVRYGTVRYGSVLYR